MKQNNFHTVRKVGQPDTATHPHGLSSLKSQLSQLSTLFAFVLPPTGNR